MELTISSQTLESYHVHRHVLCYSPTSDRPLYWATAPIADMDSVVATPNDLRDLVSHEEPRTLTIQMLGWGTTDSLAASTWLRRTCDLVIVSGFPFRPFARLFGPLQTDGSRVLLGSTTNRLTCLSGRFWHWVAADIQPAISTSWPGAMGMMNA